VPESSLYVLSPLSSRIFNAWAGMIQGLHYEDTQCGAKVFKAGAWEKILPHTSISGFAFDADLLYQAGRWGFEDRTYKLPSDTTCKDEASGRLIWQTLGLGLGAGGRCARGQLECPML